MFRIGIDVGGTNTDAVVMDGIKLVAAHKAPTTPDVASGILAALDSVLRGAPHARGQIDGVVIGTTQFTNSVIERKRIARAAIIRLCLPATTALPPMIDWPDDIADVVGRHVYMVKGGIEFDGRPIEALDETELRGVAREIRAKGIETVAIAGVFAPLDPAQELKAAEIVRQEHPTAAITLSHEIGRIGILERENAALLNAALVDLARRVMRAFRDATAAVGAPLFISQNDGTLMTAEHAERYPVLTFASGPTNSMRGAAVLTGRHEALVVDIGGTTSDIGLLIDGYPREAAITTDVGRVRTNFRMPDLLSIGLGGGTIVRESGRRIGPDSVGHELTTRARVFGGNELTLSDCAVAAGTADIGDRSRTRDIPADTVERAIDWLHATIDDGLDRVRPSGAALPVILVGGGAVLVSRKLACASEILRPQNAGVANAIGAALAEVGGECDRVFSIEKLGRNEARAAAEREATERALAAGADPAGLRIADVEELPLSYLAGAVRYRVKAVGKLKRSEAA